MFEAMQVGAIYSVFGVVLMTIAQGQPIAPQSSALQSPETYSPVVAVYGEATKTSPPRLQLTNLSVLENAFRNQVSDLQVLVFGRVTAILPDDTRGDRHQRFIVRLANSQTLLVAHNIDIAPRVSGLRVGDQLYIYGEYEWNSEGGVIHWTHHDPNRRHIDGWIQRNGTVFR